MSDFVIALTAGFFLMAIVFSVSAYIFVLMLKTAVPSKVTWRRSILILGLICAWFTTLPICGWLIEHSFMKSWTWGHVGEALFLPFLIFSPLLFAFFVSRIKP